jgi:hypothetical protein
VLAAVAPLGADYQAVISARSTSAGSICCRTKASVGRLLERRRLRRAPVHADQLQRQVQRRQHAGARARAHDAELLSNKTQPYPLAGYPIFVAEVASTFNEALLIDYMLKQIKDDDTRLSLLGNYLENIKGTVFRQTQFAEFELRMHEMAEKGSRSPATRSPSCISTSPASTTATTRASASSTTTSPTSGAYIPHFYRDFYVFQYATSFTASEALAEKVLAATAATKRYLAFLSAGGSKYPIDLLKDAGVDMTTDEPLDLTMKKMNRVMDEMESVETLALLSREDEASGPLADGAGTQASPPTCCP